MEAPASQRFVRKPNNPQTMLQQNGALRFDCSTWNEATVLFYLKQTVSHLLLKVR